MSGQTNDLFQVVTLLGAAVITVPIFKRIGFGSVLGYLFAGFLIGPYGLEFFHDSQSILHIAELGIVMFLFVIGLEMRPLHLWSLRKEIFGLGSLQILVCSFLLTLLGLIAGFSLTISFIGSMGFVLTSTAIVFQILSERGDVGLPHGQKIVSILLFEDLLIVPLLALVSFLSPLQTHEESFSWARIGFSILSLGGLIACGLWLLNPLFRILAASRVREILTAAALLVVLGSSLLMDASGLSMALGAFLAGVLLSESSFRNQLEADIEPFRGILLGLFFLGVGMSLDIQIVRENLALILLGVFLLMTLKGLAIYVVARFLKSSHPEALDRSIIMAQGGEFAFVLYAAAAQANIIQQDINAQLTSIVVLSMLITPLSALLYKRFLIKKEINLDGVEHPQDLKGCVLVVGFGRFGQVACQLLLARNMKVTIIDSDPERIRNAKSFGFQIYYGDGSRLDVLRASGAESAKFVALCIDDPTVTTKVVELIKSEFPHLKILSRSYDRIHARELTLKGVEFQIRETFESAIQFGTELLRQANVPEDELAMISQDIRLRDKERMRLEFLTGSTQASRKLILGNLPQPTPLIEPKREAKVINQGKAEV